MNATNSIPTTENECFGFWGELQEHAEAAWNIALPAIAKVTGATLEGVRAFLDSRHGRHFADDVLNHLHAGQSLEDAIHAAIEKWMGWTIGRRTSKDYGIPVGLPYLTGFVLHCEIELEMAD